ncbi:MAG: hypothetical protein U0235_12370 [Polyangiaceae bacterium]
MRRIGVGSALVMSALLALVTPASPLCGSRTSPLPPSVADDATAPPADAGGAIDGEIASPADTADTDDGAALEVPHVPGTQVGDISVGSYLSPSGCGGCHYGNVSAPYPSWSGASWRSPRATRSSRSSRRQTKTSRASGATGATLPRRCRS